ncbi:MAG: hypothetical protein V3W41_09550 [Planctomycetota bacterium]
MFRFFPGVLFVVSSALLFASLSSLTLAQKDEQAWAEQLVQRCCGVLVDMQEGKKRNQWPYEGVYRVNQKIPIGYRVGGTSIAGLALIEAPGYAKHEKRKAAIKRAVSFVLNGLKEPLMTDSFKGGYDVRGWGHTYALLFFLRLQELDFAPSGQKTAVKKSTKWLVQTLQKTAIPERGGWNYARRAGFGKASNTASPFMTGPTLQALFHAKQLGYEVDADLVNRSLDALEAGRTASGGYAYSPRKNMNEVTEDDFKAQLKKRRGSGAFMNTKPGAMGRMCVVEQTLALTDRGDEQRLRDSVETFFKHWWNLKRRKQQDGTHDRRNNGIAPYYFMYAHYYVARAIEMLPDGNNKDGYRAKLHALLNYEQEEDGGWNDRVFARSRNYGTAFGMMGVMMKDIPKIPSWTLPTREPKNIKAKGGE